MRISWDSSLSSGHRAIKGFLAAGLILGMALLFLVSPENLPFTTCEFRTLTGHSCLTCGMTRSLHAIAHGDLVASLGFHLMGSAFFIVMLLSSVVLSLEAVSGKRIKVDSGGKGSKQVVLLFAVVWLTYWGARLITEFVA